jgi:alpha-glucoside transport system substrate-binding protein
MKHTWLKLLAVLLAFGLLAAACGDDDSTDSADEPADEPADDGAADLAGETVSILGPETDSQADGFVAGFAPFEAATGVTIEYSGSRDATTEMNLAVEAGDPPDIGIIPQPGRIIGFAETGDLVAIPQSTMDAVGGNFDPFWFSLGTYEGVAYGMPNKGDVKSLVWYNPVTFADNGYEIPVTWDELEALSETMKADGIPPWCIGIGSGDATGWPFTDWMEDIMLRLHGPDVYDQWVSHEIPFNDPKVVEVAEFVTDIWFEDGNVLGGRDIIAQTTFNDGGLPLIDGECGMHRQANFYGSFFTEAGAVVGETVDVFYLPTISDEFGTVVLGAGTHAVAFNDRPATLAALEALGTVEYADARVASDQGGFLSPNRGHDTSAYSAALDVSLAEILVTADPFRFDASDLMPGEVGSGEFWRSGTDYVSGAIDVQTFVDTTEAAWP